MKSLAFVVYGEPKPQGSKRAIVNRHTNKPAVIESGGAGLRSWRQDVASQARDALAGAPPFAGAVQVELWFHLRRPKKPKNARPVTRPDLDKLARSVLDALQAAGVVNDDSQFTSILLMKEYAQEATGPPRLVAEVVDLEGGDAASVSDP